MVVDRFARDCLADALDAYFAGTENLEGMFDRLRGLRDATADETVRRILLDFAQENDDLEFLPLRAADLTKDDWDRLQRILLLMRSDAHLIVEFRRVWDRKQLVAIAAVGLFAYGVFRLDWWPAILIFSCPYGWLVWRLWLAPDAGTSPPPEPIPLPFGSRQEIAAVRRRVRRFRKRPFAGDRRRIGPQEAHHVPRTWTGRILRMFALRCIAFLLPAFLAVAMFPSFEADYRVEWP